MNEITTKEIYDLIGKVEERLTSKIEKVHDAFLVLEEGKVTELLKDMAEIKAEQKPIKMIVYGMVASVLLTVLSALLYLLLKH